MVCPSGEDPGFQPKSSKRSSEFTVDVCPAVPLGKSLSFSDLLYEGVHCELPYSAGAQVPEALRQLQNHIADPLRVLAALSVGLRDYLQACQEVIPTPFDIDDLVAREEAANRTLLEAVERAGKKPDTVLLWDMDETLVHKVIVNDDERHGAPPIAWDLLRFGAPFILQHAIEKYPQLQHGILSSRGRESIDANLSEPEGAFYKFRSVFNRDFVRSSRMYFHYTYQGLTEGMEGDQVDSVRFEDRWKACAEVLGFDETAVSSASYQSVAWLSKLAIMAELKSESGKDLLLVDDWGLADVASPCVCGGPVLGNRELAELIAAKITADMEKLYLKLNGENPDEKTSSV